MIVKFQGNPLNLEGNEVKVNEFAPPFKVVDEGLKKVTLNDFNGKIKVISVTPSLDTPVCDMQARKFEEEAKNLSDDIVILNISVDLPFAISRFCKSNNISKVKVLSDYLEHSFGKSYGVLIKELKLLARAIFLIDKDNKIRFIEIVDEITNHPNYERLFSELKKVI